MKSLITLAAITAVAAGGLFGCSSDNGYRDNNATTTGSPTSAAYNQAGRPGGEAGGTYAGVPDTPEASSAANPNRTDANRYGNSNRQGTLSGGTIHNPDANTMGGGQ